MQQTKTMSDNIQEHQTTEKIETIILASHGTPGAQAAEDSALDMARRERAEIVHLYVVPEFWRDMRGDDWLNNAVTQKCYKDYLEKELEKEARSQISRLAEKAGHFGVTIRHRAMFGKPVDCLVRVCGEEKGDVTIIGTPRKKGEAGFHSRMKLEPLVRALTSRLMIVPRTT